MVSCGPGLRKDEPAPLAALSTAAENPMLTV